MASPIGEIRTRISLRPAYGCGCELARKRHAFAVINSRERARAALSGARCKREISSRYRVGEYVFGRLLMIYVNPEMQALHFSHTS
jgi:hypothetical protein